jgi:hypothetical protein
VEQSTEDLRAGELVEYGGGHVALVPD